jgi:hypothetical protein
MRNCSVARVMLSESELLFDVGYFPPNTPPGNSIPSLIETIYLP